MNRFIALVEYDITLDQLEWVVLAVLLNQSHEQVAFEGLNRQHLSRVPSP